MHPLKTFYSAALLFLSFGISGAQNRLSLETALELALSQNPRITAAKREIEAARARVLQAEAIPNLEVGISWSETPSNFSLGKAGERSIGLVQPLTFPGKRRANRDLARTEVRALEVNLRRTTTLISAEVKRAYLQVWLNQKMLGNLEEILELLRQFQETATIRYQAQRVPYLEVLRAKTERAKINNNIINAKRELENSKAELNSLLGWPGSKIIQLSDDFPYQPFAMPLSSVIEERTQKSDARKLVEVLVLRGEAQMRLARKSYLPDFSIGLFNQSLIEQPPFNANRFYGVKESGKWQIDIGASIPLWHWKKPKGEVQEARASLGLAQLQYETYQRISTTAIENAYRSVRAAEYQVQLYESSLLRDVEDALRTGVIHYQTDKIDALNLIDLYRTFSETKSEYYRALFNYQIALADLQVAGETIAQP